jgi:hypothetical protein
MLFVVETANSLYLPLIYCLKFQFLSCSMMGEHYMHAKKKQSFPRYTPWVALGGEEV